MKGFLSEKDGAPKEFEGKVEKWREWKESVLDYLERLEPGMKAVLEEAGREPGVKKGWTGAVNAALAAKNDLALWDTLTPAQVFRYD